MRVRLCEWEQWPRRVAIRGMRAMRTSSQLNQSARSSHSRSPASSVSSHSHPAAHPDGSSSADTPGWLTGTICTDHGALP